MRFLLTLSLFFCLSCSTEKVREVPFEQEELLDINKIDKKRKKQAVEVKKLDELDVFLPILSQ